MTEVVGQGRTTIVIALDILHAFDRVWHKDLAANLLSLSAEGDILQFIIDYLNEIALRVLINGKCSSE